MKSRLALLTAGLALVAATTALALDVVVKADVENVAANRIIGAWTYEAVLSQRLDPAAAAGPTSMTFHYNEGVLPGLQAASDRFKDRRIFSAGIADIDGQSHTYVLYNENGNMKIMWMTPRGDDPIGQFVVKTIQVGVARDRNNDLLMLGGDVRGEATKIYARSK